VEASKVPAIGRSRRESGSRDGGVSIRVSRWVADRQARWLFA
jgi:hypothetical protein